MRLHSKVLVLECPEQGTTKHGTRERRGPCSHSIVRETSVPYGHLPGGFNASQYLGVRTLVRLVRETDRLLYPHETKLLRKGMRCGCGRCSVWSPRNDLSAIVSGLWIGFGVSGTSISVDSRTHACFQGVFFRRLVTSGNIHGRAAINGDATLGNMATIGRGLYSTESQRCHEVNLIVAGALRNWARGSLLYGNAVVGKPFTSQPANVWQDRLDYGCCIRKSMHYFDFEAAYTQLTTLSWMLSQVTNTYTKAMFKARLNLEFPSRIAEDSKLEVVKVEDPSYFQGIAKEIGTIQGLTDPTAVLIFNIPGKRSGIFGVNLDAFRDRNVVFHFPEATELAIHHPSLYGTIVAPYATLINATGVVYGSVYARGMVGSSSLELRSSPQAMPLCAERCVQKYRFRCWADGGY